MVRGLIDDGCFFLFSFLWSLVFCTFVYIPVMLLAAGIMAPINHYNRWHDRRNWRELNR